MTNHGEILKLLNEAGPTAFQEPAVLEKLAVFYGRKLRTSQGCDFDGSEEALYVPHSSAEILEQWKQLRDHFREEFRTWGYGDLEEFTAEVLADDIQEETPALLEKLAIMICDQETYPSHAWTHSVCHNFEKYDRHGRRGDSAKVPSFLRDPRFFSAATILVDEAAKDPSDNCFSRIAMPIFEYNLHQMILGAMDQFAWKPDSLSNLNVSPEDEYDYNNFWIIFSNSNTPRQFLESIAKSSFHMDDYKVILFTDLINKHLGEQVAQEFLLGRKGRDALKQLHDIAPGQFLATVLKTAEASELHRRKEIISGVFSDVEGTLLIEGKLNKPLADYLVYLKGKGIAVTVFTGGDTEKLTGELARQGLSADLLPVLKKEDFFGQCLEVLIDDTLTDYQPFSAQDYMSPSIFAEYGLTKALKEKWGVPEAPTGNEGAQPVRKGKRLEFKKK